jgi:hypothetical protein
LLASQRGLFATVESKSKNNSKNAEAKTREYSRNCQTSTASPAEPGGLPFRLVIKLQGSAWATGNAEIGRNWGYFGLGDHSGMIGDKPLPLTNQG